MNWKQVVCYTVGCQWQPADDSFHGIAGAFKCARCSGLWWPAVVWPKASPMPACTPPRIEQAERIQALSLAAGDTLIITMPHVPTKEQRERLKADVGESIPEGVKVVVLDPGMTLSAIKSQASIDRLASAIEAMRQQFPGHVPPRPIPQPRTP